MPRPLAVNMCSQKKSSSKGEPKAGKPTAASHVRQALHSVFRRQDPTLALALTLPHKRGIVVGSCPIFTSILGASLNFSFLQAQRDVLGCDALCYGTTGSTSFSGKNADSRIHGTPPAQDELPCALVPCYRVLCDTWSFATDWTLR